MSKFVIVGSVTLDGASVAGEMAPAVAGNFNTTGAGAWESIRDIADFLESAVVSGGIAVLYYDTAVSASTTGTFTGAPVAAETMSINGVTFTARASGATGNEFNIGSTVTATAANLAAAINASTTANIVGTVGASSAAGVVTFYSLVPGSVGLNIPISESLTNFTLADTTFSTGGTQAHSTIFEAGVAMAAS